MESGNTQILGARLIAEFTDDASSFVSNEQILASPSEMQNKHAKTEVWRSELEAAQRKIAIARHHLTLLEQELAGSKSASAATPSIPVQAHFEGAIVSVMAAVDQVAHAYVTGLGLKGNKVKEDKLFERAFTPLAEVLKDIDSWMKDPIGRDLRRIRTRIVHYSYGKTPVGPCWVVETAGTDYHGSRELLKYASAAVEFGERLGAIIPQIELEISNEA